MDARELHAWLEVGTKFADWIKERIGEYGFLEGRDFLISENAGIKVGRGGDRKSKTYHLTLDMAKELSMVERNEKGKEARAYFIKCEKRLKAGGLGNKSRASLTPIGVIGRSPGINSLGATRVAWKPGKVSMARLSGRRRVCCRDGLS